MDGEIDILMTYLLSLYQFGNLYFKLNFHMNLKLPSSLFLPISVFAFRGYTKSILIIIYSSLIFCSKSKFAQNFAHLQNKSNFSIYFSCHLSLYITDIKFQSVKFLSLCKISASEVCFLSVSTKFVNHLFLHMMMTVLNTSTLRLLRLCCCSQ